MFALKPLSHESVGSALAKAEHYRLLNESAEAESICRDILAIEPQNERALICFVLALSDQIGEDSRAFHHALEAAGTLAAEYDRFYYSGIVWERRAKALRDDHGRGTRHAIYDWMMKALKCFEEAERLRPPTNDDALLRWNTCVRFLSRHPELTPQPAEAPEPIVSE